jgi:Uma2 family endonuclease
MSAQPILTYDDYIALPEDGPRYELYDGRLIVMPPTSPCHQAVIVNLFIAVAGHVWRHGLGDVCPAPIDVLLSRITVLQPDLVYLDAAGPGLLTEGPIVGTPTLVVEVLAPPTDAWDRGVKQALYARYGVPYYWIVDPTARSIQVLRLGGESYEVVARLDEGARAALPPLAGLTLDPAAVWP